MVHGDCREEAIFRLIRAIDDYHIAPVKTTLKFCKFAVDHQAFRSGNFDTHFVRDHFDPEKLDSDEPHSSLATIIAGKLASSKSVSAQVSSSEKSNWRARLISD